jgi:CRISPR/Cas system CSM-associated protein Csm4 (group 5 of RAMP superfamily)
MEEKANGSRKMKKLKKMPIKPAEIFAKGFAETKNGSAEIAKGSAKTANGSEETKNGSAKTANGSTETKNGF